jgi:uncharacterized protein YjbJ (UPF0337 family)
VAEHPAAGDPLAMTPTKEEHMADKDRIEGSGKQAKGSIKEGVGKLTGDQSMQAEGKADKGEGKIQNAVGGVKDKAREMLDKT